MNHAMAKDRVDVEELMFDLSHHYLTPQEQQAQRQLGDRLARSPDVIESVYELPADLATAMASAINSGDIKKLTAQVEWDVNEYISENGAEQWL